MRISDWSSDVCSSDLSRFHRFRNRSSDAISGRHHWGNIMTDLIATIDAAWEDRANVTLSTQGPVRQAVDKALSLLDSGEARVAEPKGDGWPVNQWLKKAVLLSFRLNDNADRKSTSLNYSH